LCKIRFTVGVNIMNVTKIVDLQKELIRNTIASTRSLLGQVQKVGDAWSLSQSNSQNILWGKEPVKIWLEGSIAFALASCDQAERIIDDSYRYLDNYPNFPFAE